MFLPTKVLIATDFSPTSVEAITAGLDLARSCGARAHLLHVCEPIAPPDDLVLEAPFVDQRERQAMRDLRAYLKGRPEEHEIETLVEVGEPVAEILRAIEHYRIDLVVVGTHGRHGTLRVLLGSVAEKVLRAAPCPVLVVRPHGASAAKAAHHGEVSAAP